MTYPMPISAPVAGLDRVSGEFTVGRLQQAPRVAAGSGGALGLGGLAKITTSLLLAVLVSAASIQDSTAGQALLERIAAAHPTIRKGWADRGYREYLLDHAARLGTDLDLDLEIVRRAPGTWASPCNRAGGRWKERSAD